ncbi:MAG: D-alanyl-D-alanine carboxypeptidase family protein, partial [Oscillospiraceae bacterium]
MMTGFAAFTPSFALYSEGVYVVNLDTDIVVVSKNADKKLYPASTTKIMTCLVALANIKNFDAYVDFPTVCTDEFTYDTSQDCYNPNYCGASSGGILPGQSNLTYWDVLYSTMLPSGCDSANVLAYNVGGGSIEKFISMMNKMAKQIGCTNTHFSNAHGLFDEDNYTTAHDMYLITKYAIDNYPAFMKICNTLEYDMPANSMNPDGYTITHTNQLIKPSSALYYEGVEGIKTGSIDHYIFKNPDGTWDIEGQVEGSRALVTMCSRNGYTYLVVTLGAPYYTEDGSKSTYNFDDHIALYDWVFDNFEYTLVIGKNEQIMQVDVDKGKDAVTGNPVDKIGLVATEDYYTLLPKTLDLTTIQQIRPVVEMLEAPITKGELIDKMTL